MILTFLVRNQTISYIDTKVTPRIGSSNYLQLKFNFVTKDWSSLRKTLHISAGEYSEPFILGSNIFDVPTYYTQQESFKITLLGDNESEGTVVPTNVLVVSLDESNNLWSAEPPDPQNSAYIELLNSIGNLSDLSTEAKNNLVAAINEAAQTGGGGSGSVQSDWNQNDSTAADYVKNRPFYTGEPVKTVLVEETTVSFADAGGLYIAEFPSTFEATVGDTYAVNWDGTEYECVCSVSNSVPVLGNLSIPGAGSDTGEPFVMRVSNGKGLQIYTLDTSASHTISISGFIAQNVQIPDKYISDTFRDVIIAGDPRKWSATDWTKYYDLFQGGKLLKINSHAGSSFEGYALSMFYEARVSSQISVITSAGDFFKLSKNSTTNELYWAPVFNLDMLYFGYQKTGYQEEYQRLEVSDGLKFTTKTSAEDPVQRKVVLEGDSVSAFTNDAGYLTLDTLPNPKPLTFTGAVTGSYDGSAPMTVNIPEGGGGTGGGSSGTWELIGEVTSDGAGANTGISIPCDISGYKSVFVYAQNLPKDTNFRIVMRTTLTWSQFACFFGYNLLGKQGSFNLGAQSGKMNNPWSITGLAYNVANRIFAYGAAEAQYNGGSAMWRQGEQSNKLPTESWNNIKYISLDRNSSTDIVPEGCILRAWGCK